MNTSDLDLEQGFVAREKWAMEALYVRHAKTFYTAAFSVLESGEDAQDCVHDVLLRIWGRPNTFAPGKGSLKAFVAVSIRNEAVSRLRLQNRAPELHRRLAVRIEEEFFEPADHVERDRLQRAIRMLPIAQRRALVMSYFQHLTHREISEKLGEPLGTIKSRISTALRRLHDTLAEGSSDV